MNCDESVRMQGEGRTGLARTVIVFPYVGKWMPLVANAEM